MLNLGPMELLVILVVALVVLGPDRLPQVSRQVGKAVAELRRWSSRVNAEVRSALDPNDADRSTPPPSSHDGRGHDIGQRAS